jgi:hypothetical protein
VPDSKPAIKKKLSSFVTTIRTLRKLAIEVSGDLSVAEPPLTHHQGATPASLIQKLLELIGYEDYLRKTEPEWETRWENVQELITFATDVEVEIKTAISKPPIGADSPAPSERYVCFQLICHFFPQVLAEILLYACSCKLRCCPLRVTIRMTQRARM